MGDDTGRWNAARSVTRQVADEHGSIRSNLVATATALREMLEARSDLNDRSDELTKEIGRLTDTVRLHFHSEERSGLFHIVVEMLPDAADTVQALRDEHAALDAGPFDARVADVHDE